VRVVWWCGVGRRGGGSVVEEKVVPAQLSVVLRPRCPQRGGADIA